MSVWAGPEAVMDAAFRNGFSHVILLDQDSDPRPKGLDWLTVSSAGTERDEWIAVLAPLLVPPPRASTGRSAASGAGAGAR